SDDRWAGVRVVAQAAESDRMPAWRFLVVAVVTALTTQREAEPRWARVAWRAIVAAVVSFVPLLRRRAGLLDGGPHLSKRGVSAGKSFRCAVQPSRRIVCGLARGVPISTCYPLGRCERWREGEAQILRPAQNVTGYM